MNPPESIGSLPRHQPLEGRKETLTVRVHRRQARVCSHLVNGAKGKLLQVQGHANQEGRVMVEAMDMMVSTSGMLLVFSLSFCLKPVKVCCSNPPTKLLSIWSLICRMYKYKGCPLNCSTSPSSSLAASVPCICLVP